MTIDAATGIARILKAENVPWVSTFPVSRINNALGREGVPLIMTRDDRYAVALADAFSRITCGDRIGVCTIQGGINAAGTQVAFAGLAQAYEDNSPVLCFTGGVPAGASENSHFDVTSVLKSVSKWYGYIDRPERVPEFMRRAFTLLRTGRPGPVVLAVPDARGEYDETADPYVPPRGWKSGPDPADVEVAVRALLGARKPLLYVGEGVLYAGAWAELRTFAEQAGLPVVTTLKAKGVLPEDHPLSVGVRGDHVTEYLTGCDLILAIGSSLSPGRFSHAIPDAVSKTIIQCNVDERDINRVYESDHVVLGDARFVLQALTAELSRQAPGGGGDSTEASEGVQAAKDRGLAEYRALMASDETPINPYRVYGDMMKVLDRNASFVTHESGNTRDQLSTVYETLIPRGFLGWGNVSTLGFSFAASMAARLAYPDRQSVAVVGEAGLSYMLGNLEVLVRQGMGVTIVHISNGGFAGYGPGFWGPGHDPFTYAVLGPDDINMATMIAEFGLHTQRVTAPGEIVPALEGALAANESGRPAYLEIVCSQHPVYGQWVRDGHGE